MEKLCSLLERASEGEVDAMDHLKVDTEKKITMCFINPTREDEEDMLRGLDDALYIFEAAKRLKMGHLSHLAKQNVAYLKYIYKSVFNWGGGGRGYLSRFWVGVCRPGLQMWTPF